MTKQMTTGEARQLLAPKVLAPEDSRERALKKLPGDVAIAFLLAALAAVVVDLACHSARPAPDIRDVGCEAAIIRAVSGIEGVEPRTRRDAIDGAVLSCRGEPRNRKAIRI